MTSTLTAIRYSGRANPTATIDPLLAQQIWALLDDLPVSIVAIDLCWKCIDGVAPMTVDALITRFEGDRKEWAFLTGQAVVTRRGSHVNTNPLRALVNPIILSINSPVVGAMPLHKPTTTPGAKAKADERRLARRARREHNRLPLPASQRQPLVAEVRAAAAANLRRRRRRDSCRRDLPRQSVCL